MHWNKIRNICKSRHWCLPVAVHIVTSRREAPPTPYKAHKRRLCTAPHWNPRNWRVFPSYIHYISLISLCSQGNAIKCCTQLLSDLLTTCETGLLFHACITENAFQVQKLISHKLIAKKEDKDNGSIVQISHITIILYPTLDSSVGPILYYFMDVD